MIRGLRPAAAVMFTIAAGLVLLTAISIGTNEPARALATGIVAVFTASCLTACGLHMLHRHRQQQTAMAEVRRIVGVDDPDTAEINRILEGFYPSPQIDT